MCLSYSGGQTDYFTKQKIKRDREEEEEEEEKAQAGLKMKQCTVGRETKR